MAHGTMTTDFKRDWFILIQPVIERIPALSAQHRPLMRSSCILRLKASELRHYYRITFQNLQIAVPEILNRLLLFRSNR